MWKKIKNIIGPVHEINRKGEIRMPLAWRNGDFVKNYVRVPSIDKAGAPYLVFRDGYGNQQNKKVHHLVADTFIPNPHGLPFVTWKNGDKNNCAVSNLIRTDKMQVRPRSEGKKINTQVVRSIRLLASKKVPHVRIAETVGVSPSMISHIVHKRKWAHVN